MPKKNIFFLLFLITIYHLPFTIYHLFAQVTEEVEKAGREIEKEREFRERIEKPRRRPEIEEKEPARIVPAPSESKAFIKKITVSGVTFIPEKEIKNITSPFENRELSLREMYQIAERLTDNYRQKGYITSRAYLPPQKIEQGILEIRVLEGMTGDIQVKNNRYFKTSLLRKKIALKKGQPFNYNTLREGLSRINEHPDRNARAVLEPGKEAGTTDVILEMKEQLPLHLGLAVDNFGSRYIEKDRYSVSLKHNNLFGLDDKLAFQYQLAQASRYFLKNLRYLLPLTNELEVGLSAAFSRVKLGQDLEDADVRGKSSLYGLFLNRRLIEKENLNLTFNLGFDYKDITNYQLQAVFSHDRLRIAKFGWDMDATDNLGRSLISQEFDFGIPNIMGGLKEQDSNASRSGSGGKFIKNIFNLARLQKMPFSSTLLWKAQIQQSPYILTAAEQFQIGGISNVRGYPPAEAVGDQGYANTFEWSFPVYPLSRKIKVPLLKARVYDALKAVLFYDWARASLRRPTATEEKNKTLRGVGCGLRFNLPENFFLRLDFAWPLDNTPSDGDHQHTWFQISKEF